MIAWGSSETFSAHNTYGWLQTIWLREGWSLDSLPFINHALRKIGHFCVYGTLSVLLFVAWRETLRARRRRPTLLWSGRLFLLAAAGTMLIACADEFHQTFVPGRTGVPRDVLLDTLGALFAQMILLVLLYGRRSTRPAGIAASRNQQDRNQ